MRLRIVLDEGAKMPLRAHAQDAGMDLFTRQHNGTWKRSREEHVEYAHDPEALRAEYMDLARRAEEIGE